MWDSVDMAFAGVAVFGIASFLLALRAGKAAARPTATDHQQLVRTLDRIEAELRTARQLSRTAH